MPQFVKDAGAWQAYKERAQQIERARQQVAKARKRQKMTQDMSVLGQALTPQERRPVTQRIQGAAQSDSVTHPTTTQALGREQPSMTEQLVENIDKFKTMEGLQAASSLMTTGYKERKQTQRSLAKKRLQEKSEIAQKKLDLKQEQASTKVDRYVRAVTPDGKTMQLPLPKKQEQAARLMSKFPEGTKFKEGLEGDAPEYTQMTAYDVETGEKIPRQVPEGKSDQWIKEVLNDPQLTFRSRKERSQNQIMNLKRVFGTIQSFWKSKDAESPGLNLNLTGSGSASPMNQQKNQKQAQTFIEFLHQKAQSNDPLADVAKQHLGKLMEVEGQMMESIGVGLPEDFKLPEGGGGDKSSVGVITEDGTIKTK